jgi:hypothetical protein
MMIGYSILFLGDEASVENVTKHASCPVLNCVMSKKINHQKLNLGSLAST